MNKIKVMALSLLVIAQGISSANAEDVRGVVNKSATGTTSATLIVEGTADPVELTDQSWRMDASVTTGLIAFRSGDVRYPVTSATSASSTQLWFANTGTAVAVGDYVIIHDVSDDSYILNRAAAATTTSITVQSTISPAITTSDNVWSVNDNTGSEKPIPATASATSSFGSIWLPAGRPTAVTIDGNTTSCRISVSGVRSPSK